MEVRIKRSYAVKPAKSTWTGTLALSELDQIGVITHFSFIYFYEPFHHLENDNALITTLKDSLSWALVRFYPLSGRLSWIAGGRLELHCNSKGAELIEAEYDGSSADFREKSYSHDLFHCLFPFVDYKKPIEELPLLLVQVTTFKCGGISLGITMSHAVVDGQSAFHFVSEWAKHARGEAVGAPPYLDRSILIAKVPPRGATCPGDDEFGQPPLLIGQQDDSEERKKKTAEVILPLSKDQVDRLKGDANRSGDHAAGVGTRAYSRYETITGHVWRSACRARGHVDEQPTSLSIIVDGRRRLQPPLPNKYFGNAIVNMLAFGRSGELVSRPLSYACRKVREAIDSATDEHFSSVIHSLRNREDLSVCQDIHAMLGSDQGPFLGNPSLGVVSWLNLPLYNMDFGWGSETCILPGTCGSDGAFLVLPTPPPSGDGSVLLIACLQEVHMDQFKTCFYEGLM